MCPGTYVGRTSQHCNLVVVLNKQTEGIFVVFEELPSPVWIDKSKHKGQDCLWVVYKLLK